MPTLANIAYSDLSRAVSLDTQFQQVVDGLPHAQKSKLPWHRSKVFPCAALALCCSCKEYKPVTDFYALSSAKAGRKDITGTCRNSQCKQCSRTSHVKTDQHKKMLYAARHHAKEKGVPCTLTVEDIVIPTRCPVLGLELKPQVGLGRPNCRELSNSPSIDRVEGHLGYVPGNIEVISTRANHIKSNGTLEEFQALLRYAQECQENKWPDPEVTEESNCIEIRTKLIYAANKRSKARGLEMSLTVDDLKIPVNCPVLGVPLKSQRNTGCKTYRGFEHAPSIDRINNSKGYTTDNIRIISARANHLKSDATLEEIKSICDYIARMKTLTPIQRRRTS
jgi:hypothetical protein